MTEKENTGSPPRDLLLSNARECVRSLVRKVLAGDVPKCQRLWSGGGVAVVYRRPHRPKKLLEWYPDPRFLVTPYASEVSWIFDELWKAFRMLLDSVSKVEFFGQLVDAALSCSGKSLRKEDVESSFSLKRLLLAILYEAVLIERKLGEGSSGLLPVSSGNPVDDDRKTSPRPKTFPDLQVFFETYLSEGESLKKIGKKEP